MGKVVYDYPQENHPPKGVTEWTFADWFGQDLTGKTYPRSLNIICHENKPNQRFQYREIQLTSLKGAPEVVRGTFNINHATKLRSLKYAPKKVTRNFHFYDCDCFNEVDYLPEEVGGWIIFEWCNLTSFGAFPEKLKCGLSVAHNKLTSFDGAPKEIGNSFYCGDNDFQSLEGVPKFINGDFCCEGNRTNFEVDFVPSVVDGDISFGEDGIVYSKNAEWKTGLYKSLIIAKRNGFSNKEIAKLVETCLKV